MSTADAMSTARPAGFAARRAPVVAMVGAGQLARMTHQASIGLGVELRVLAESAKDPAVCAGARHRLSSPAALDDLRALAADADVLTFDHERISPEHLRTLEDDGVSLAPGASAKLMAQDKHHARRRLAELGFPVPAFAQARTLADVDRFAAGHGWPLIAKRPRGGYDGRGVYPLRDLAAAAGALAGQSDGLLLEPHLAIERELAVLLARSTTGDCAVYPVVETVQRDAMCREITAPAPIPPELAAEATRLAREIGERIDATGILAVELFHTSEGLVVNELALRPHNSGHYTIEGCVTSQFEQHLRAVLGWPLGLSHLLAPAVATVNVIGPPDGSDPATRIGDALAIPGAHVHLYGKDARPGRKLGHVTVCGPHLEHVRSAARQAAARLEGASA